MIVSMILLPICAALYACFIGVFTTLTTFCAFIEGGIKGIVSVHKKANGIEPNNVVDDDEEYANVWEKHIAKLEKNKTKNSGE